MFAAPVKGLMCQQFPELCREAARADRGWFDAYVRACNALIAPQNGWPMANLIPSIAPQLPV